MKKTQIKVQKKPVNHALLRLDSQASHIRPNSNAKFHEMLIQQRRQYLQDKYSYQLDSQLLDKGGISLSQADIMTQNVIGIQSLPLSIIPYFVVNGKLLSIPMSVEQPSVVAACSSIGKLLSENSEYSFKTTSTLNQMIGQVFLPMSQKQDVFKIVNNKQKLINTLNESCVNMQQRGGGVKDITIRQLGNIDSKQYSVDILINVCDAMGANKINSICQIAKSIITSFGIQTGVAILSNYCLDRRAYSSFQIPVSKMKWKGMPGELVVSKILQTYQFAKLNRYRAVTHNKGIMNGIDAVCLATGQDWRAVQATAHCFASRTGSYQPLTHYEIVTKEGVQYFKGSLQLPIAVGTRGGAIHKNPLYQKNLQILGNPTSKQLSEIIVSVGLAQNLAALRALSVQGIQKGHMKLHERAQKIEDSPQNLLIKGYHNPKL